MTHLNDGTVDSAQQTVTYYWSVAGAQQTVSIPVPLRERINRAGKGTEFAGAICDAIPRALKQLADETEAAAHLPEELRPPVDRTIYEFDLLFKVPEDVPVQYNLVLLDGVWCVRELSIGRGLRTYKRRGKLEARGQSKMVWYIVPTTSDDYPDGFRVLLPINLLAGIECSLAIRDEFHRAIRGAFDPLIKRVRKASLNTDRRQFFQTFQFQQIEYSIEVFVDDAPDDQTLSFRVFVGRYDPKRFE